MLWKSHLPRVYGWVEKPFAFCGRAERSRNWGWSSSADLHTWYRLDPGLFLRGACPHPRKPCRILSPALLASETLTCQSHRQSSGLLERIQQKRTWLNFWEEEKKTRPNVVASFFRFGLPTECSKINQKEVSKNSEKRDRLSLASILIFTSSVQQEVVLVLLRFFVFVVSVYGGWQLILRCSTATYCAGVWIRVI